MSDIDNVAGNQRDPGTMLLIYFAGISKIVHEEFGGSVNGTRVVLPTSAWKWMPKAIEQLNLTGQVRREYGNTVLEIPGYSFFWQDEAPDRRPKDDPNA